MLDEKYIQNLEKYLGKKIPITSINSKEVIIGIDWDMNFILREKDDGFSLTFEERGVENDYEKFYYWTCFSVLNNITINHTCNSSSCFFISFMFVPCSIFIT